MERRSPHPNAAPMPRVDDDKPIDLPPLEPEDGKPIEMPLNNAEGYYERGWTWLRKSQYDKAIKDFDQTLRLEPKSAAAFASSPIFGCMLCTSAGKSACACDHTS